MIYSGKAITVQMLDNGIAELCFNLEGESVNKFDQTTTADLKAATAAIVSADGVKGVLVTSGKSVFIVGADITEFGAMFDASEEELAAGILATNKEVFNRFEDLDLPTVAAINGIAFGGGLEMCLICDYRVMSTKAKVGLPETKLGIVPGFGGTVRLPRVIGSDNAVEWIASGKDQRADAALAAGAVDAVVAPEKLKEAGIDLLNRCIAGEFDYKAKRQEKLEPLLLNDMEAMVSFETAKVCKRFRKSKKLTERFPS